MDDQEELAAESAEIDVDGKLIRDVKLLFSSPVPKAEVSFVVCPSFIQMKGHTFFQGKNNSKIVILYW